MGIGEKTWVAPTGHRTVLQLQRISYQITLLYLGDDRIRTEPTGAYRCKVELQRGAARIASVPAVIENIVSHANNHADAVAAATPAPAGDTRNPPADQVLRVMITDNHALRAADDFLGTGGDANSKTDSYQARNWMRDVRPAVPFRVIVRCFQGGAPIDLAGNEKVLIEVKDPVEEFSQNQGAPRQFLDRFFNRFNRTGAAPDRGDDNAPVPFDGVRPANAGPSTTDVFKKAAYAAPPVLHAAPNGPNSVTFGSLSAPTPHGGTRAKFDLTAVTENGVQVGVADPVFFPWPAGGDNYRFLLTVLADDQDVRDRVVNGDEVMLLDHEHQMIPKPRAYVTGRFVVWRRVHFRLVVLVNNTAAADINWASIRTIYARDFMDVVIPPASAFFNLALATWRNELRSEFDPGGTNANFNVPANFNAASYNAGMFPPFLQPSATMARLEHMTNRIIRHACTQVAPPVNPDPTVDTAQDRDWGLFMMFCKLSAPLTDFSAAGAYIGDRIFWFAQQSSAASTTSTAAHELGHALYLRHSHTDRTRVNYVDAGGAASQITLVDGLDNNNMADHDQNDAFACLMSYTRPVTANPCGGCTLTVRFYDRVAVARDFANEMASGLSAARIVQRRVVGGNPQLNETIPNLPLNNTMDVLALGRLTPYTDRAGNNLQGRANISCLGQPPLSAWSKSGAGDVSFTVVANNRIRVRGTRRGAVAVTYQHNGVAASVNFTVT